MRQKCIGQSSPVLYTNEPQVTPGTWQVLQDLQQPPPQPDSEEQRVVYKSSPTQRSPSEPPEAAPCLSGRQLSADEDTLRQRLIAAMQRPSGTENAGQLADTLSLRSAQCTLDLQRAGTRVEVPGCNGHL